MNKDQINEKININIDIDHDDPAGLIEPNYPGQHPRQKPIYLKIYWNEGGRPRVTAFAEERKITGHPFDEHHGTATAFRLPDDVDASALAEFVADELAEKIIKLNCEYKVVWDGSNHVGQFECDSDEYPFYEIEQLALDAPTFDDLGQGSGLWAIGDWLEATTKRPDYNDPTGEIDGIGTITADTTDDEIDAMAEKIYDEAADHNVILDGDPEDYIREIRDDCKYYND